MIAVVRFFTMVLPAMAVLSCVTLRGAELPGRSHLATNTEPGALYVEDILPKPVRLAVAKDTFIYYQTDLQRVLGSMAAGTLVQVIAMSDGLYKVRGRARHGDVAGWTAECSQLPLPAPCFPPPLASRLACGTAATGCRTPRSALHHSRLPTP